VEFGNLDQRGSNLLSPLAYPNYSEEFEIFTDGSKKQLGAVITQKNRPLAFFSRKLSEAQQKYSVTKIELLATVESLKEYRGMLWGQKIKVYTDHQNLMRDALGLNSMIEFTAGDFSLRNMAPKLSTSREFTTQLRLRSRAWTLALSQMISRIG
jgi:hypothetical protein